LSAQKPARTIEKAMSRRCGIRCRIAFHTQIFPIQNHAQIDAPSREGSNAIFDMARYHAVKTPVSTVLVFSVPAQFCKRDSRHQDGYAASGCSQERPISPTSTSISRKGWLRLCAVSRSSAAASFSIPLTSLDVVRLWPLADFRGPGIARSPSEASTRRTRELYNRVAEEVLERPPEPRRLPQAAKAFPVRRSDNPLSRRHCLELRGDHSPPHATGIRSVDACSGLLI
jgi:hypothetical protein